MSQSKPTRRAQWALATVILLGVLIRVPWLATDWRVTQDLALQRSWARASQNVGIVALYDGRAQLYPPLTIFIFHLAARMEMILPAAWRADERALNVLLKLPALLADVLTAFLLAMTVWTQPRLAVLVAAVYLFHPGVFYVSVFWGQVDSVYTALMIVGLVALEKNKLRAAWLAGATALGIKLQALAFLPVLLPATLTRGNRRAVFQAVFLFVGVLLLLVAPWWLTGQFGTPLFNSIFLESRTPRVVVSGYNLWYLILQDQAHTTSSLLESPLLGLNLRGFGFLEYGAYASFIALCVWRKRASDLTLAAALTSFGLFLLPTQVHERFLLPVIALLLLAAAQSAIKATNITRTRMLVGAFLLVSLTFCFNLITIAQPNFVAPFNLIAQPTDSSWIFVLKKLALSAAALNLIVFGGLTFLFWKGDVATDARI